MSSIGKAIGKLTGADEAAKGAEQAARTQAQYAQMGIGQLNSQFDVARDLMTPFMQAATGSFRPITGQDLIDTGGGDWKPNQALYASDPTYRSAWDQFMARHKQQFGSTPNSARGSDVNTAIQQLRGYGFDVDAYNQAQQAKPQTMGSLTAQQNLIGLNGEDAQRGAVASLASSPEMAAYLQQGENAILQNASATGGLRGGNVQGALAQFRPALLAELINQQYSRLGGLTSLGAGAAGGVGSAAMQTGSNVANLMQQQGAALAGGQIARANVARQGFGDLMQVAGAVAGGGAF